MLRTVPRWLAGMALISWRYLWQTTPLHRSEERGDETDLPPELPTALVDERSLLADDGCGQLFHRTFSVRIEDPAVDPATLIGTIRDDMNRAVPGEAARVCRNSGEPGRMCTGDEFTVHMPGPWNGPVRVVSCTEDSFRLATLEGHLEAGLIEFRARPEDGVLRFEVEAWARPSSPLVDLLYAKARLAKEMQLNMWVRCCLAAAALAGGRPRGGVTIRTRCVPAR
ncbi:DUF1990 domain-containing protein [Saccharopolyspora rosea]|uniref:DUF1990 domain-containing protein n=1 Tax=Saccharopolyspora rosea TaxID=524884 RepID=A0ABW3FRX3_9PSEU|nr:DUF1990 domain-containing protein [Saccharopolyspora rosea]